VNKKKPYNNRNIAPSFQVIRSLEMKYQKNKLVIMEKMTRFWKTLILNLSDELARAGTKIEPKTNNTKNEEL
jgi:hypothetical protein